MKNSDDEELKRLAEALKGRKLSSSIEKVKLNLSVSAPLARRLQLVYPKQISAVFEEEMLARLIRDGFLKEPTQAGGGADAYFNRKPESRGSDTAKKPRAGDVVWDPDDKTMRIVEEGEGDDE